MSNLVKRFIQEDDGATMVEYGIMIAAIAAICTATVFLIGGKVKKAYTDTNAAIP
jgi:pilus assembly protein Flp/PilA